MIGKVPEVVQAVNNATLPVKMVGDYVKKLAITRFIFAPHCIGYEVCILYTTGSL